MDDEGHENHGPIRSSSTGSHESPSSSSFFKPNNNNGNANAKEQDRFLPIANVGRIMKKVIPGNGKISKEARETVQVCVSEFISFVTGEASDKCQREKRKTINGDDIIWAITTLGFEDYVNPLKLYLTKYREIEDDKPTTTNAVVVPKQEQQQSSSDYQHQNQSQSGLHHHPLIDQTAIMCANAGGLPAFLPPPPPTVYSSSHTHQHPSPPPPPPFVGSAQQPLMSLPAFLPSNSLQKTYHQHPEQIDSVGW